MPQHQKRRWRWGIILLIALLLLVWIVLRIFQDAIHHPKLNTLPVSVGTVVEKTMPRVVRAAGFIEPVQAVNVQAQVSGTLDHMLFQPGQLVRQGQVLYQLDASAPQAMLRQNQAQYAQDVAQLQADALTEKRYDALRKQGYISEQVYDQADASYKAQQEKLHADLAAIQLAQIQLGYATIRAPISGIISDSQVKVGDFINMQSATTLTTIQGQTDFWVDFYLPEQAVQQILEARDKAPLKVWVYNAAGTRQIAEGTLSFVDNAVNSETGTVLLKASVTHMQAPLLPGASVRVTVVLMEEPNALVIPSTAVYFGQKGNFVYRPISGKVLQVPVTVDRQLGVWTVIARGLSVGDSVIVKAPPTIQNHSAIRIVNAS